MNAPLDASRERRFWLLVAATYVLAGALATWLAPCGNWFNSVFGVNLWEEADPGGQYLADAHRLWSRLRQPAYTAAHPGATLELLLHLVQLLLFGLGRLSGDSLGFTPFISRHVVETFIASKVLMTALHVASFFLVFRLGRALGLGDFGAKVGALCYATSFPVLFYLSRISVEPLEVLCFCGAFLCLWRSLDAAQTGPAARWAGGSALCAGLGVVTKLHLMGPLPAWLLLVLLVTPPPGGGTARPWARRGATAAAFAGSLVVTVAAFSLLIDWPSFFAAWTKVRQVLGANPSPMSVPRALVSLLPGVTRNGLFLYFEAPFLATALVGAALSWRAGRPSRALWVAGYALLTVGAWLYRGALFSGDFVGFHYLILVLVAAVPFVGKLAELLAEKLAAETPRGRLLLAALLIFGLHHGALWAALDSRQRDVAKYQEFGLSVSPRHLDEALAGSGKGKVGIVTFQRPDLRMGLLRDPFAGGVANPLLDACEDNFRVVAWTSTSSADAVASRFKQEGVTVVVDDLEGMVATAGLEAWRGWRAARPVTAARVLPARQTSAAPAAPAAPSPIP